MVKTPIMVKGLSLCLTFKNSKSSRSYFPTTSVLTDLQHCFLQPVIDKLSVALFLLQLLLKLSNTSFQPSLLLCNLSTDTWKKVGK